MNSSRTSDTGARSRTRRAILRAAASVLARQRTATLADIARAAEVNRSTVHRYFADRDELIKAAIDDSVEAIGRSVAEAEIHKGPAAEAMRRLVVAHLNVGDRLMFLFGDQHTMRAYGVVEPDEPPPDPMIDLIERGQREGVFDPESEPRWIQRVLWSLVYAGIEEVDQGRMSRHGVAATVIRTLESGIRTGTVPLTPASGSRNAGRVHPA